MGYLANQRHRKHNEGNNNINNNKSSNNNNNLKTITTLAAIRLTISRRWQAEHVNISLHQISRIIRSFIKRPAAISLMAPSRSRPIYFRRGSDKWKLEKKYTCITQKDYTQTNSRFLWMSWKIIISRFLWTSWKIIISRFLWMLSKKTTSRFLWIRFSKRTKLHVFTFPLIAKDSVFLLNFHHQGELTLVFVFRDDHFVFIFYLNKKEEIPFSFHCRH